MGSSDHTAPRTARPARIDLRLALLREGAVLPWRHEPTAARDELSLAEILAAAAAVANRPGALLLSGGDPVRRSDSRELLTELARLRPDDLGICTAGHGLTATVAARLRAAGVRRVQVPFHCARQDAHDWLVGQTGALRTTLRAIRACLDAELEITAEVVLTRPTVAHLAETLEVLGRIGVRTVCVRRLTTRDANGPQFVPLSPRLELLQPMLEQAAAVALERRLRLRLRDLPLCAAPRLRPLFARPETELWVLADGSVGPRETVAMGCATCPGPPQCAGVPADYAERFGWEEFIDPAVATPRIHETVRQQQAVPTSAPMTFAWRGPRRVRCDACGDPAEATAGPPYGSTRAIRAQLVQAARFRPAILRLVGADLLAHPQAAALIFDAVRLFPHVEVAGEASPVVDWTDLDLRRLKDLRRIDVALYGPDAATHDAHCGIPGAFAAMLRGVERLRSDTAIAVGSYAILHDARWIGAFAEAWERGVLPGPPRFRLSGRGGSLDELLDAAQALPPGSARSALLAVLPRCRTGAEAPDLPAAALSAGSEQTMIGGRSVPAHPCGSDPVGSFESCPDGVDACAAAGCVGMAVGWGSTARSQRWSGSI